MPARRRANSPARARLIESALIGEGRGDQDRQSAVQDGDVDVGRDVAVFGVWLRWPVLVVEADLPRRMVDLNARATAASHRGVEVAAGCAAQPFAQLSPALLGKPDDVELTIPGIGHRGEREAWADV